MKLAIMQPYFFPYLGYFQLIRAAEKFVAYDDVNYIKGGWINRNYILANSDRQLITLPLCGASPNKLINEIEIGGQHKILQSLRQNYGKAPHFNTVYPLLEGILTNQEKNLAKYLIHQLQQICIYLNINTEWFISSNLTKNNQLRGQDKVINICEKLGASQYINLPGGRSLYNHDAFYNHTIKLSFLQPRSAIYHQPFSEFIPNLSIIDVMMYNDRGICAKLLEEYDLV